MIVVGELFFFQPLGEEVVEHQHLELVPPLDLEGHMYLHLLNITLLFLVLNLHA